jgi:hypothetical protein
MGIATSNHCPSPGARGNGHAGSMAKHDKKTHAEHIPIIWSLLTQTIEQGRKFSPRTRCPLLPDLVDSANSKLSPPVHCAHVGRTADFQPFPTHLTSLLQYLLATRILFGTKAMKAFRCCFGPSVLMNQAKYLVVAFHQSIAAMCRIVTQWKPVLPTIFVSRTFLCSRPARTARWFALQL